MTDYETGYKILSAPIVKEIEMERADLETFCNERNLPLFDNMERAAKDYWLREWRRMMCRKMFEIEDSLCSTPVEVMPCKDCRYYVDGNTLGGRQYGLL